MGISFFKYCEQDCRLAVAQMEIGASVTGVWLEI